ncbi:hypothetical protein [Clavibacter michiganensis]|uniref:hypothetical protein n=1 Tax=Clavibacter michiganensis TaxID=28447 RepID=UPI00307993A8
MTMTEPAKLQLASPRPEGLRDLSDAAVLEQIIAEAHRDAEESLRQWRRNRLSHKRVS